MAVFNTDRSRNAYQAVGGQGWHRNLVHDVVSVAMATTMIDNVDDDVGLLYVPAGAVIVGAALKATDMDGATTLAFNVGDAGDEDRIFANKAAHTGISFHVDMAQTGYLHKYTVGTQLRAYVNVAATTPAPGTLTFGITYFVDPDFNTTPLVAS